MYDEIRECENFSHKLQYYLDLRGISKLELAEKLGVSPAAVTFWIQGKKMPRMGKIQAIADILNIKKSDLVELPMPSDVELKQDELFEKRKLLFDKSNKASEEDLDKIIQIVEMIVGDKD